MVKHAADAEAGLDARPTRRRSSGSAGRSRCSSTCGRPARSCRGWRRETILTSGAPLPWSEYTGGQRRAIVGGALFEGLAADPDDGGRSPGGRRASRLRRLPRPRLRRLRRRASTPPRCRCSWSRTAPGGNRAFCNLFEGVSPKRLNYGVYDDDVRRNLLVLQDDRRAHPRRGGARRLGGVPLRPIMRRALHMGDELHSRNTAATLLFTRELFPALLDLGRQHDGGRPAAARLRARQRLLLPAAVDGGVQGDRRRRARRSRARAS